jgi:hypothetical protein
VKGKEERDEERKETFLASVFNSGHDGGLGLGIFGNFRERASQSGLERRERRKETNENE